MLKYSERADTQYWDQYWSEFGNYERIKSKIKKNSFLDLLIKAIQKADMPSKPSILEIGGAPGKYVTFLGEHLDASEIAVLDYSKTGVEMTAKFLQNSVIPYKIYNSDLLEDDLSTIQKYDLVYSLGLIEHFDNTPLVFDKHLELVKQNGYLLIGMPVYLGLNKLFAQMFYPRNRETWYDNVMDFKNWSFINGRDDIKLLYKAYVGGFNVNAHYRYERGQRSPVKLLYIMYNLSIRQLFKDVQWIKKINSKFISNYAFILIQKL